MEEKTEKGENKAKEAKKEKEKNEVKEELKKEKEVVGIKDFALIVLLVIGMALVIINQSNISALEVRVDSFATSKSIFVNTPATGISASSITGNVFAVTQTGDTVNDAINAVIPTGTTPYGNGELSYDNVVDGLQILKSVDVGIKTESLTDEQLQRYINVGTRISCEYCCGAKAIIFPNGAAACGCAHSFALRGLAKYLITEYGDQYSDEDILMEMTKWKNLFFPRNTVEKAVALIENGIEITPDALNDRGLLSKISAGDTSSIGQLSAMVGGC